MGTFTPSVDKVISPDRLAHVVLRTANFPSMVSFYKTILGATATFENEFASFLTYDEEHHRIAIIHIPNSVPNPTAAGLEHIAFTYNTLDSLAASYRQRKSKGIEPYWCVNHGPTTSMYYKDPDGNRLEFQVDNMEAKEANEFMASKEFIENPIGADFEPQVLIQRIEAGEDHASIKKRIEIGARGIPTSR